MRYVPLAVLIWLALATIGAACTAGSEEGPSGSSTEQTPAPISEDVPASALVRDSDGSESGSDSARSAGTASAEPGASEAARRAASSTPLRDWDFDLLAEPLRYGPYVITAQSEPAVQADGSAWQAQFAGWRHEDAPAGDPGGELGIQIMGVPPELSVVETYATRSVSPEGEVAYQHFQVEFRTEGRERYVAIYRFAFVAERFGAPGIGVYGTIPGSSLVLELGEVDGHPSILERPIRGDASGTFHRLRWVSENVETIIEGQGVPQELLYDLALQIERGGS